MNSLLDKLRNSYAPKKRPKIVQQPIKLDKNKNLLDRLKNSYIPKKKSPQKKAGRILREENQDLPGIIDHIYKSSLTYDLPSSWQENRTEKRIIDQFHYRYLYPLIRYNAKNKITTIGISLPSDGWVWEQELAKNFKKMKAKFDFIGVEGSSNMDLLKRFLTKSYKLNQGLNNNFKTRCYVGPMSNLLNEINSKGSIKLNCLASKRFYPVDFIYADFMGYWASPIINIILSIFNGPRKIKKNGYFFMTIYLARGSKDKNIRLDTIEAGRNINREINLGLNNFNIHDSNYMLRDLQKDSVIQLYDLIRGIGAFTWKMAYKQGIQLYVHDVQMYYNEYVNESGREVRSPMASFYFTKLND